MRKRIVSRSLALLMCFAVILSSSQFAFAADGVLDNNESDEIFVEVPDNYLYSFVSDTVEKIKTFDGADFLYLIARFTLGISREAANFVSAQFFTEKQVNEYSQEIIDAVSFKLVDVGHQDSLLTVYASVPIYPRGFPYKLMNLRVLRRVCKALEEQQKEYIPEDVDNYLLTSYPHFVGELELHLLVYLFTRNLGGENGPVSGLYNSAKVADLNQTEPRFSELIKIFGDILA